MFIKPAKNNYAEAEQQIVQQELDTAIKRHACAFRAVSKVHIMGSAKRHELGCYQVPFVHGKLAKLGSDVDILIEIDENYEQDVPTEWKFINAAASNHCAIYHLGEIALRGEQEAWTADYPNIPFAQHLIDAYVHFPSRGYEAEKDAFLKKFGAQIIYDREQDGMVFAEAELEQLALEVQASYSLENPPAVEKMKVSTENALFKVSLKPRLTS